MKIWHMIAKDLKVIFSDKKALVIMLMMPIILITILSFALGSSFSYDANNSKVKLAIVKKYDIRSEEEKIEENVTLGLFSKYMDGEQIEYIKESIGEVDIEKLFFEEFLENDDLKEIVEYSIEDEEIALKLLEDKKISAIIILPQNFIYDMHINLFTPFRNKVDIKVIGHPDLYIGYQVSEGIVKGFTDAISSMIIGKNVFIETALEENLGLESIEKIEELSRSFGENNEESGINIDNIKVNGKNHISSFDYYSVAMMTMFILFTAGYGSKSLLKEKNDLTYQRMIMAGTERWKIVLGKFFTMFVFALFQISVIILYSSIVLKVDWVNYLLSLLISICAALAVSGLGIMIAAITYKIGNYTIANGFESAFIQIMALFGGSFFPVDIMPSFIQGLSNLSLNGVALKAYLKIMMGYGINEIISYLLILIGMTLVFTIIAINILNRGEEWKNAKHNKVKDAWTKG